MSRSENSEHKGVQRIASPYIQSTGESTPFADKVTPSTGSPGSTSREVSRPLVDNGTLLINNQELTTEDAEKHILYNIDRFCVDVLVDRNDRFVGIKSIKQLRYFYDPSKIYTTFIKSAEQMLDEANDE